jgi:multicomponent Na+:H+ antiporter subunit G
MRLAFDIATVVFLAAGCFVAFSGALGVLRMPDFYTRLHAAGKTDSFAQGLICVALFFQAWRYETIGAGVAIRLVLVALFILATSPVATHAITRAAYLSGLKPWQEGDPRA